MLFLHAEHPDFLMTSEEHPLDIIHTPWFVNHDVHCTMPAVNFILTDIETPKVLTFMKFFIRTNTNDYIGFCCFAGLTSLPSLNSQY
jgi:hypothetical protein